MGSSFADETHLWFGRHGLVMTWLTTTHTDGTGVVHLSKAISSSYKCILGGSHQLLLSLRLVFLASLVSAALRLLLLLLLATTLLLLLLLESHPLIGLQSKLRIRWELRIRAIKPPCRHWSWHEAIRRWKSKLLHLSKLHWRLHLLELLLHLLLWSLLLAPSTPSASSPRTSSPSHP
jgi:hypothetical protein